MAGPAKSNQEVFAPGIRPDFVGLIRFAHPAGQPSAVTALRYVSSFHRCSRGPTGCGPPTKCHPWPIAALAASMPLNPLHNDSTRPPDGAFGVACEIGDPVLNRADITALAAMYRSVSSVLASTKRSNTAIPESRQEAECRCCGEGRLAWMPNEERWARDGSLRRPSEQRRSEGSFAQRNPDAGRAFSSVTFCASKEKRSEAE